MEIELLNCYLSFLCMNPITKAHDRVIFDAAIKSTSIIKEKSFGFMAIQSEYFFEVKFRFVAGGAAFFFIGRVFREIRGTKTSESKRVEREMRRWKWKWRWGGGGK